MLSPATDNWSAEEMDRFWAMIQPHLGRRRSWEGEGTLDLDTLFEIALKPVPTAMGFKRPWDSHG